MPHPQGLPRRLRRTICTRLLAASLALAALQPGTVRAQAEADGAAAPGRRIDDRRPAAPTTVTLGGLPVVLTGSWELSLEQRRNFDLNRARARDRRVQEHEIQLEAATRITPDVSAFVQLVGLLESRKTQGTTQTERTHALERGEMWLLWERLAGTALSLQVGRIPLIERRAWWWDDELDAARLRFEQGPWRLETGLGRTVARISSREDGIDPAERGIWRHWGQASWRWAPRHALEAFWLRTLDRSGPAAPGTPAPSDGLADPDDLRATWLGLRASGEWRRPGGGRWAYWADLARVDGDETRQTLITGAVGSAAGPTVQRRLQGRAVDIGSTYSFAMPLRPSLTLAYARGSGGERSATRDGHFRQTGLHENKVRIAGVKRLRRYGELLQPELSNLVVGTWGTGLRVLDNSSVELLLHRYRQVDAATSVAGGRLSQAPQGLNRDLGREWNLFVAVREWQALEFTLSLARFEPGAAYPASRRDPASRVELGIALNF